jgi:oxygen-dependent protoporphyrinogen oxidase
MSRRIVVVGGGISGLAAAHRLGEIAAERSVSIEVLLLEAGPRLGGVIRTERRDGFLCEGGPDSFISDRPWAMDLCRRLGLAGQLEGTNTAFRRSFVAWRGRLVPVPEGFQVLAPSRLRALATSPLFTWRGKLRVAREVLLPPRAGEEDESLGGFVERRFGREALERLAEPLIAGIYGADPYQLSLAATLPRFRDLERQHGSVIRALRARRRTDHSRSGVSGARYGLFVSLRDGMETLVDALAARLSPACVRLDTPVTRIQVAEIPGGSPPPGPHAHPPMPSYMVHLADGSCLAADAVCLALPAPTAAWVLAEADAGLADLLKSIPYGPAATLNLAYRRSEIPHPLDGFGFVVPASERQTILGCTFASVKFPGRAPEGAALLRVFLGGAVAEQEPDLIEAGAGQDLRRYLGITAPPLWSALHRWPCSMPRYRVGHLEAVAAIEARLDALRGLALAGNAYRGIGLPDTIHSGEMAAERLMPVT